MLSDPPITYDSHGRMRYHPAYHAKQMTHWTTGDEAYLVAHYYTDGPEQVSLALERTIHTVMQRACYLRAKGRMTPPAKRTYTKRTKPINEKGTS